MSEKIDVGDEVECVVVCGDHGGITIVGTVLYPPSATGDGWHIKEDSGRLVYVHAYE